MRILSHFAKRGRLAATALAIIAILLISSLPAAGAPGTPKNVHLSWLHDPHTTVNVTWETEQGVTGYAPVVRYGTGPESYTTTMSGTSHPCDDGGVDVRDVELTGLEPDTTYYYQAGDVTNGYTQEYSFRTPPLYNTEGFKFCAFGDTRNPTPWFESGGWERWESVANAVDSEKPLFNLFGADFVLNTLVSNTKNEWNAWFSRMSFGPDSVFMSCHGNHEKYSNCFYQRFAFPKQLPGKDELTYSFDVANAHFVCLDTGTVDDTGYDHAAQDPWLRADLQSAKARGQEWIFVNLHRPAYSAGDHGDQADIIQYLVPVFDEFGVDIVFEGHVHAYERSFPLKGGKNIMDNDPSHYGDPDGTIYCLTGSAGAPYASLDSPLPAWVASSAEDKLEYCTVEMTASNKCVVTCKEPGGNVIDSFTLSKTSPPVLTSASPSSGLPGSVVTLNGSNFGGARGTQSRVLFGSTPADSYVSWSDSETQVRVPEMAAGAVTVKVETPEGSSDGKEFTVLDDGGDIDADAYNWYFAEGTCRPGFDPYICIQNPAAVDTEVNITYMRGNGENNSQKVMVPARSRQTVRVKDTLGEGDSEAYDFSASVVSTGAPVIVERPMYFDYRGMWDGGHDVMGANSPAEQWYFAEGTCRPGFDAYICIQNPGTEVAEVDFTYMLGDGETKAQSVQVPAQSRFTVRVKEFLGEGGTSSYDFSTRVKEKNGRAIIVERPMYFNYGPGWTGGHCVVGARTPSRQFYFAEGTCRPNFEPYLCVQNPGDKDAEVTVLYMLGNGENVSTDVTVKAHSRYTIRVKDVLGEADDTAHDFSARVTSNNDVKIIVERPMYFNYGPGWPGGHCVIGYQ